ncbi:TIGR02594 family protein [Neolewinella antarctica]|uniref:Uncharacterized protein (TIGR02594 family) n=1 Tax=Neolewinella antarctica TaxID=442734 RepID=A0ABX0X6I3_9BACT|nr:TIGR02594 family protein [Neolewinella antarctica]NJC24806.1 uncharacterized protein (TIGR02594 family) [Neolewinella antarctica]
MNHYHLLPAQRSLLTHALSYAGNREVRGPKSNAAILDIINKGGFPNWKDDSTIAWCSCFVNAMALSVCMENTLATEHPGLARGWLKVGVVIPREELRVGDIVVFDRGGWKGHVGFFLADHGTHITVFGGNQGSAITVSDYKMPFLGGRRLRRTDDDGNLISDAIA